MRRRSGATRLVVPSNPWSSFPLSRGRRLTLQTLSGSDRCGHRAGDASAAEAAIAIGVLRQVLLVIPLGKVEGRSIADLGGDLAQSRRTEPTLIGLPRRLGGGLLLRRECIDCRPVLGPDVVALAHALGRVMALPEQLEQCLVAREFRIIDDEHGFGVATAAAAHLFVGRVRGGPAGVADRGDPDARRFPEHPLRTPKAAEPEDSLL